MGGGMIFYWKMAYVQQKWWWTSYDWNKNDDDNLNKGITPQSLQKMYLDTR